MEKAQSTPLTEHEVLEEFHRASNDRGMLGAGQGINLAEATKALNTTTQDRSLA